jgi:phage baseplate assembly protein gpV
MGPELNGLIRAGRVSSVNDAKHTARVQFYEGDGLVSFDLNVLVMRPGDYSLPAAGTAVLCLIPPGNAGIGYVIGALYSDSDAPPLASSGQRSIASDDLRLGDPNASQKVALAPKVNGNFSAQQSHFKTIEAELVAFLDTAGASLSGAGGDMSFSSSFSAAATAIAEAGAALTGLSETIAGTAYPSPEDTSASKVSAA